MFGFGKFRSGLIPAALLALAACDAPVGLEIPQEAVDTFADVSAEDIIGRPSTATLFATFEGVCVDNLARLNAVPSQLQANGYTLLGRDSEIAMYASPEASRPLVGLAGGRVNAPEFCMVLAPDTSANRSGFTRYLEGRPGNESFNIQIPGAEAVYVNAAKGEVYIVVRERDPALGNIIGVGVGGL